MGDAHDDGELSSTTLWQIRGALASKAETKKADTVILQHHFLLTRDASFNQAADALVKAAIDLHYPNPDINAIRTILRNRGFTVTL